MSPGSNASSPIAISRNDEPQISPIDPNRAQSSAVNAPRWVPTLVDKTPRRTGAWVMLPFNPGRGV
jgi:hypothetical protein